ncbi:hypothetical protein ASPWEDRAFT_47002 [Aspergillus wentii DTO 134E9]|uniref:Zn(2)-C6 fungal-type domain-containing protein n=1 Tax=Aspergillus wentii DTO 134E9 TaxID=1073089 RepID=A0A1L9RZ00_ASPWE|nr:uncharacterized protein ASPWEDRAFT_47002 [Aspergillus wentii DTO 134E9]KAI9932500.1 hypothetical protein MW887_008741 [Aspergillus wentii]OJJ40067.1 hypothetical protein ASPWEDRAFT_47002 [Aspergillus wentii DTO 134E9]
MPPRRAHTKSRNGCDRCKERRVKCDEQGPPCANCISRELQCTYLKTPKARSLGSASSESHSPVQLPGTHSETANHHLTVAQLSSPSKGFELRDLELMHKFSTETYRSLCNDSSDYHVWQIMMPRKALEYDFLLSGILALAALHMASAMEPAAALSYIDTALQYHNLAFSPFRKAIDNLTPLNCDAVFAHSLITTVIGIALPQLTAERDEGSSMTENIIVVFELLQGVSKILRISRPWLKTRFFPTRIDFWDEATLQVDSESGAAMDRLAVLNDDIFANADTEHHRINKDAISLLRRCFGRFSSPADAASVLAWLAAVDKVFVYRMRCREPFSLLILMHWGVLLGELHGQFWWAKNSGKALVSELLVALHPGDPRWDSSWRWPQQKLGF